MIYNFVHLDSLIGFWNIFSILDFSFYGLDILSATERHNHPNAGAKCNPSHVNWAWNLSIIEDGHTF